MRKYFINFSLLTNNRNFGLLYLGQFVSFLGTMITSVALPYQIYHLTHSTLMVGLLSLVQLFPLLVTALIGGVLADRYHRRGLLLFTELILASGCLALALSSVIQPRLWSIFAISFIMSAVTGLHRPALDGIVQQLVRKEDFAEVGSLGTLKYSVSMILGPAIGGLLIAAFGIATTYLIDCLSFVASLVALLAMTHIPPPPNSNRDESTWDSLRSGFRYATSRQELMGTYWVDFIAMVFGMPTALFPAIASSFGGPKTLGMLYTAPAVGALFVSFFGGLAKRIDRHGLAVALSASLWAVAIVFFGMSNNFWISLVFLAFAGAFDAISGIFRTMMWNDIIPNNYRGRLAGIEMISYLSGPRLGDLEAGLVSAATGISASIISGGILGVLGVGILSYFMPKFLNYNSRTSPLIEAEYS